MFFCRCMDKEDEAGIFYSFSFILAHIRLNKSWRWALFSIVLPFFIWVSHPARSHSWVLTLAPPTTRWHGVDVKWKWKWEAHIDFSWKLLLHQLVVLRFSEEEREIPLHIFFICLLRKWEWVNFYDANSGHFRNDGYVGKGHSQLASPSVKCVDILSFPGENAKYRIGMKQHYFLC